MVYTVQIFKFTNYLIICIFQMNRKTPNQICVDVINNNEKNEIENSLDVKYKGKFKLNFDILLVTLIIDKNIWK